MGPGYFILAILGCGEAEAPCKQVAVADALYTSAEACTAETEHELARHIDIAYPVVVAECRRADARPAQNLRADEVKLPSAGDAPRVQPASYRPAKAVRT